MSKKQTNLDSQVQKVSSAKKICKIILSTVVFILLLLVVFFHIQNKRLENMIDELEIYSNEIESSITQIETDVNQKIQNVIENIIQNEI